MRLQDDELRERTGKAYAEWVAQATDAPLPLDALLRFNEEHGITTQTSPIRRLHREMEHEDSTLRVYLREHAPPYDAALRMDMDLRALRDVLKAFETHIGDSSHNWYSSTPLNIALFYQLHALTGGTLCWKVETRGAGKERGAPPPKRAKCDDESQCVYAIFNHAERAPNGGPKVYIGRTCNLTRRMREHASANSACTLVRRAIQTYGFHTMVVRVLVVGTGESIRRSETALIAAYDSLAPRGYNLRCGDTASETSFALATREDTVDFEDLADSMQIEAHLRAMHDVQHMLLQDSESAQSRASLK